MRKKTSRGAAAAGSRAARVGELLRQELSSMFQDGWVRDPRFAQAFVTVTGVTMSADLAVGTVHVSVYAEDRAVIDGVLSALGEAARDLRREVGRRLTLRHTPDLRFRHDGSAAYGEKMERLLKDIRSESEPEDTSERTDPDIAGLTDEAAEGEDPGERTNPDALIEGEDTPAEALTFGDATLSIPPANTQPDVEPLDAEIAPTVPPPAADVAALDAATAPVATPAEVEAEAATVAVAPASGGATSAPAAVAAPVDPTGESPAFTPPEGAGPPEPR